MLYPTNLMLSLTLNNNTYEEITKIISDATAAIQLAINSENAVTVSENKILMHIR